MRCLNGQRAVHEYLKIIMSVNQMLSLDMTEIVKKLLGTSHREGRNHDVAAPVKGFLYDTDKLRNMIFSSLMEAISVGRLHDCIICLGSIDRITDQWFVKVSDIAGKYDFFLHAVFPHPDFNRGGAQQMSDIGKPNRNILVYLNQLTVIIAFKMLQNPQGIVHLV